MNQRRYQAWQFVHPDLDYAAATPGLQVSLRGNIANISYQLRHSGAHPLTASLVMRAPGRSVAPASRRSAG